MGRGYIYTWARARVGGELGIADWVTHYDACARACAFSYSRVCFHVRKRLGVTKFNDHLPAKYCLSTLYVRFTWEIRFLRSSQSTLHCILLLLCQVVNGCINNRCCAN